MAFDIASADEKIAAPLPVVTRRASDDIDLESAGLMLAYMHMHGDDPALDWMLGRD